MNSLRFPVMTLVFSSLKSSQYGINPFSTFTPAILGWVEIMIYGYVKNCDHLIKGIEAGMLAVILIIHNRAWRAVNNIGQLFLCHPAGLPSSFDGSSYIVKIKSSFVLLHLHNITQCNFIFHVIVFERLIFSYYRLFNFTNRQRHFDT